MYDDTISWNQQLKIYPLEACSISSLEFDPFEELLWIGSSSGRIQSYLTGIDFFENQEVDIDDPMRYSSFTASESPIINMWPLDRTILQVSQTKCSMHTKGGMLMSNIATIDSLKEFDTNLELDYPISLTCSSIYRKMKSTMTSYELEAQFSWQLPTHLFVGTNSKRAFCYDLNNISSRGKPSTPMQQYDTLVGSTCVKENGSFIFFGGNDGKVRLFDGRLNGERVQHVIDAHNGSVVDMSVHINGMIVATCGLQTRSINPYDPNSPVKYGSDPYVKLLDLRMMKSSTSLALSAKAIPQSLRFRYQYSSCIPSKGGLIEDNNLIVLTTNGLLESIDTNSHTNSSEVGAGVDISFALDQDDLMNNALSTSMTISSTGSMVAIGTSVGTVSQFSNLNQLSNPSSPLPASINADSRKTHIPLLCPQPDVSLSIESPSIATAYVITDQIPSKMLVSSMRSTPSVIKNKCKLTSTRRISNDLISKMVKQDFIGTIPNPGFKENTLIFGSNAKRAYIICDPRKVVSESGIHVITNEPNEFHISGSSSDHLSENSNVPPKFRLLKSPQGLEKINSFDYFLYNKSNYVSFENATVNAYVNPILQVFHSLGDVKAAALASQASIYHQSNSFTLWAELGFLFHMMNLIKNSPANVPRVVTANNFHASFRQIPETVALGLIETSSSEPIDSTQTVQLFLKFMLSQLQRELESEIKSKNSQLDKDNKGKEKNKSSTSDSSSNIPTNPIDKLFGYSVVTNTTFLQSGTSESGSSTIRATTLDIVYPLPTSNSRNKVGDNNSSKNKNSFSAVIFRSLSKESYMRGWCEASKSYEPFRQVRNILNVPKILSILCGDTFSGPSSGIITLTPEKKKSISYLEMYWASENCIGGSWLSEEIEIIILKSGEIIVSELLTPASKPEADNQASSTNVSCSKWLVFNGSSETIADHPASINTLAETILQVNKMKLIAVISSIFQNNKTLKKSDDESKGHPILHLKLPASSRTENHAENSDSSTQNNNSTNTNSNDKKQWYCFNDFQVTDSSFSEASAFQAVNAYRYPSVVIFSSTDSETAVSLDTNSNAVADDISIKSSIFQLPSLSSIPSCKVANLPVKNDILAFDGEFVSVEAAKASMNSEGKRIMNTEGRQFLARISVIDTNFRVIIDDYIVPSEPVVDYLTRFSGITADDLNPVISRHSLVHSRTALLKLRYLVDQGCIIVGHGLQKDFATANIFVPPEQVLDTVELWRLPNKRKIALKFLAAYLLNADIQDEKHDSIEDSKTALELYLLYVKLKEEGGQDAINAKLQEIYSFGNQTNWTLGLGRIKF